MTVLALESSTALGSVALLRDGRVLGEESSLKQRSHSEFLNSALSRLAFSLKMSLSEVDMIAVSVGPGSFTGVRVAGGLAKSLAYSLKKEIWAVDSLSVLASMLGPHFIGQVFSGINAYKNMMYCSCFLKSGTALGPTTVDLNDIDRFLTTHFPEGLIHYVGDATDLVFDHLSHGTKVRMTTASPRIEHPTAAAVGELYFSSVYKGQTLDWKSFTPLYLRGSEAEENLRLKASES
jgi:tRNA threonylcarbamoyladenosine biosynthesis protein TsaB